VAAVPAAHLNLAGDTPATTGTFSNSLLFLFRRFGNRGSLFSCSEIGVRSGKGSRIIGMPKDKALSRDAFIKLLNEDLAREYQAIIAYVIYSQTMKGAQFTDIARELEAHAGEELSHAILIAKQIDYLNGTPVTVPKAVKMSDKAEHMLRFDLENERQTILQYRQRIRQAEAMGEFGISEVLRKIIAQEQEHLTDLADALGIDNPKIKD
jgi:bacterioferritin